MRRKMNIKLSGLKPGDRVRIVNCYEARSGKYEGIVFNVTCEPRIVSGSEVVRLESEVKTFPAFATEFLEKVC